MNSIPRSTIPSFSEADAAILNCVVAAPSHQVAAEWVGCSPTHLRRLLKVLRERFDVDNNLQLVVLASLHGAIDPAKVLPGTRPSAV